jgi:GNAT superfamily N-acetyltransferase
MTTTLRPAEPERRGADGVRSRRFTVCVNSRPVGEITVGTDARFGPEVGRLDALRIEPADRRRGRGTVAALAAEEVLRGWGCRRIDVAVPADAPDTPVALRLAAALGYVERNRVMAKPVPASPPGLPEGSAVRPMNGAEYAAWDERERAAYVQSWIDRGLTPARASALADADYRAALPDGPATPDTALRVLSHHGADVGHLWLRLAAPAWVFLITIDPAHRGHGHGRSLMLAAESECAAAGVPTLGLNVYTANTPATRLYDSLGYRPTEYHLSKPLL